MFGVLFCFDIPQGRTRPNRLFPASPRFEVVFAVKPNEPANNFLAGEDGL